MTEPPRHSRAPNLKLHDTSPKMVFFSTRKPFFILIFLLADRTRNSGQKRMDHMTQLGSVLYPRRVIHSPSLSSPPTRTHTNTHTQGPAMRKKPGRQPVLRRQSDTPTPTPEQRCLPVHYQPEANTHTDNTAQVLTVLFPCKTHARRTAVGPSWAMTLARARPV